MYLLTVTALSFFVTELKLASCMRNLLTSLNVEDLQTLLERSLDTATENASMADEEAIGKIIIYCSVCAQCYNNVLSVTVCQTIHVTGSEKTDHSTQIRFLQYGSIALQRSRSRDFAISMPRCSTASQLALTQVSSSPKLFLAVPTLQRRRLTLFCKICDQVGGEIYRARGSSLYLMTGTRDVTTCADIVYRKYFRTHLSQISLVFAKNDFLCARTWTRVTRERYMLSRF